MAVQTQSSGVPSSSGEDAFVAVLETVHGTTFKVAATSTPWDLGVDALVLSIGPNGLGELGMSFFRRFPSLQEPGRDLVSQITPDHAIAVPLPNVGRDDSTSTSRVSDTRPHDLQLGQLIYATIREPNSSPDPSGSAPPEGRTVARASRAAVEAAGTAAAPLRSVALPILGTGIGGLDFKLAAQAALPAVRAYARDLGKRRLNTIIFFAPDSSGASTIEDVWHNPARALALRMLADQPIDDPSLDMLGTNSYAEALAVVIDHPRTPTPLTIAINARWGAGKTSLANLVIRSLRENAPEWREPIICWFNAWHHDDAPTIVPALASSVARAAALDRALWRRLIDPLPARMLTPRGRRRRHLLSAVLTVGAGVAAVFATGAYHSPSTGNVAGCAALTLAAAVLGQLTGVKRTAEQVAGLIRAPDAAFATGSMDDVRADLGNLIHQATRRRRLRRSRDPVDPRRLVVFIDDLERCVPARSIEVCETVSNLLSHEDVVVVLLGDMQTIATAAEAKYKDLAPRYRPPAVAATGTGAPPVGSFGELYLEKIIQFRFDVPTHDLDVLRSLAASLLSVSADTSLPTDERSTADELEPQELGESVPSRGKRFVAALYGPWRARRARRRRRRDSAAAQEAVESGLSPRAFEQRAAQTGLGTDALRVYRRQMLQRQLDTVGLVECFESVSGLIRPLPRDVKRLLNRIRFLLWIANDRNLLSPDGPLLSSEIGKWALIAERWPDLALAVSADPNVLGRLESQTATWVGFNAEVEKEVPGYAGDADLWRVINAWPPLSNCSTCLARLRVETQASSPATHDQPS